MFLERFTTPGFRQQLMKVRSISLLVSFTDYVIRNLPELQCKDGMLKHLRIQHNDPSTGLLIPSTVCPPQTIWLFDFIGSLIKARSGKSQAFGYSSFAVHSASSRSLVGKMPIGVWCSCFMNQYFNRRDGFSPPVEAEHYVAEILAETLKGLKVSDIIESSNEILDKYIIKEYEAVLLAHRGFDPIGGLIEIYTGLSLSNQYNIRSAFAEKAGLSGLAGITRVIKAGQTIIKWQSVSDAGRDHKKKELCGRAVALRYTWDAEAKKFKPRPGVKKLILVVDGTWRQDDLNALVSAGWDEVFYPDEMDKLKKAII